VWRKAFDDNESLRTNSGLLNTNVFQSADNPNKVTIIGEAPSVEAVKSFFANPALKAALEKGGVIGVPDIKFLIKD
jgi:quinol monooxygenase YgiN